MIQKQAQTKLVKNRPTLKPNKFVRDSFLDIFYRCRNTYLIGLGRTVPTKLTYSLTVSYGD